MKANLGILLRLRETTIPNHATHLDTSQLTGPLYLQLILQPQVLDLRVPGQLSGLKVRVGQDLLRLRLQSGALYGAVTFDQHPLRLGLMGTVKGGERKKFIIVIAFSLKCICTQKLFCDICERDTL